MKKVHLTGFCFIVSAWACCGAVVEDRVPAFAHLVIEPFRAQEHSRQFGYRLYIEWGKNSRLIDRVAFLQVDAGSLAEKAGIRSGDRLTAIDGNPVRGLRFEGLPVLLGGPSAHNSETVYRLQLERGLFNQVVTASLPIGTTSL